MNFIDTKTLLIIEVIDKLTDHHSVGDRRLDLFKFDERKQRKNCFICLFFLRDLFSEWEFQARKRKNCAF